MSECLGTYRKECGRVNVQETHIFVHSDVCGYVYLNLILRKCVSTFVLFHNGSCFGKVSLS